MDELGFRLPTIPFRDLHPARETDEAASICVSETVETSPQWSRRLNPPQFGPCRSGTHEDYGKLLAAIRWRGPPRVRCIEPHAAPSGANPRPRYAALLLLALLVAAGADFLSADGIRQAHYNREVAAMGAGSCGLFERSAPGGAATSPTLLTCGKATPGEGSLRGTY